MKKKVVKPSCLPMRPPVLGTIVYWLALEYWQAPGWIWGVVGTIMVTGWALWIYALFLYDPVDIFKDT